MRAHRLAAGAASGALAGRPRRGPPGVDGPGALEVEAAQVVVHAAQPEPAQVGHKSCLLSHPLRRMITAPQEAGVDLPEHGDIVRCPHNPSGVIAVWQQRRSRTMRVPSPFAQHLEVPCFCRHLWMNGQEVSNSCSRARRPDCPFCGTAPAHLSLMQVDRAAQPGPQGSITPASALRQSTALPASGVAHSAEKCCLAKRSSLESSPIPATSVVLLHDQGRDNIIHQVVSLQKRWACLAPSWHMGRGDWLWCTFAGQSFKPLLQYVD